MPDWAVAETRMTSRNSVSPEIPSRPAPRSLPVSLRACPSDYESGDRGSNPLSAPFKAENLRLLALQLKRPRLKVPFGLWLSLRKVLARPFDPGVHKRSHDFR